MLAALSLSGLPAEPLAGEAARNQHLALRSTDVIPTGNEWISLPDIRANDGAVGSFNVLSMRDRGLLEVKGDQGKPVLTPYFKVGEKALDVHNLKWELIEYWTPVGRETVDGLEVSLTYCAPPGSRAAFVRMTVANRRAEAVPATLGLKASWGALSRTTYTPTDLKGERTIIPAPWAKSATVFPFITHDTHFAWALSYHDSEVRQLGPPMDGAPGLDATRTAVIEPGQTLETHYVIGVGIEEYSASQSLAALEETIDRVGMDSLIADTAAWCRARTKTTGHADLDLLMNRNYLFTRLYAWGRTLDTEQLVGVTSRSSRYYVSAAYWDRDAMLWSFPSLLDIDPAFAREALQYAFTTQLRNTGLHSRFIDGTLLEDGLELDEVVAPVIALSAYTKRTGDHALAEGFAPALAQIRALLETRYIAETGLYTTLQDAQDEYRKQQFNTYDNVLVWKALLEMAEFSSASKDAKSAEGLRHRADSLHKAILDRCAVDGAPGATGPILVSATDGKSPIFADVPPGSFLRIPALEFLGETDPLFVRTYDWIHSKNYPYSNFDKAYGLPGSYRVPFTTPWAIADHLSLKRGHEKALKVLLASPWDGGIITEGVDPITAEMDYAGRGFATAAGYVAHAICQDMCESNTVASFGSDLNRVD
jgi:hypothetical protein